MALPPSSPFGGSSRQAAGAIGMNTRPQQHQATGNLPAGLGPQTYTKSGLSLMDQFGPAQAQAAQQTTQAPPSMTPIQRMQARMSGHFDEAGYDRTQQSLRDTAAENDRLHQAYQDPSKNPAAAFQRIIGTSENFYDQQSGESPMDRMLRDQLMQRVSGQQQPYDATTIGALKTGANEMAAQAEMVNNQRAQESLAERGFKPGDAGYQAAMSRNQLSRQQANQQAALGINQQANLANYNARGQAIGQAAAVGNDQYQRQAGALDRLQRNYDKVSINDLGTAPRFRVPSYSDFMKGKQ